MRLSTYTDYSLRVLMYLGLSGEKRTTIQDIATSFQISKGHTMKIVHELGKLGYIETTRGRVGGLKLAKPPEAIGLGEVVRKTETDFDMVPCFISAKLCPITPSCSLKGVLSLATRAYLKTLDEFTLADLLKTRVEMSRALALTV